MDDIGYEVQPVALSDTVTFRCRRCAECCKHLTNKAPLEIMDAYKLGRALGIETVGEVFDRYADPIPILDAYPIFTLKTAGPEQSCVFLQKGLCSIYEHRPRVCRLYPFSVEPLSNGKFRYVLCRDTEHHFTDGEVNVGKWMHDAFGPEIRDFVWHDYVTALKLAMILKQVPPERQEDALRLTLYFRYFEIDTWRPLKPQYEANHKQLFKTLRELITM